MSELSTLSTLDPARPIALVTGGTRRVGLASADRLAAEGCQVVVTSRRGASAECPHRVVQLPLAPASELEHALAPLAASLPRLDVLVLNASAYEPTPTASVEADELHEMFAVNAVAPLLIARSLAPMLARSPMPGGGSIVAMADIHAMGPAGRPRAGYVGYSMSKAAMVEMVLVLARELAPRVRVNAVAPGVVAFPESGPEADEAARAAYLRRVPLARSGTPQDAAEAVAFLALHAPYITGQILRVDGGRSLA